MQTVFKITIFEIVAQIYIYLHGFRLKISIFLITCVTTVKAHCSWRQQRIHGRQRIHALQFVLLTTNTLMYTPLDNATMLFHLYSGCRRV